MKKKYYLIIAHKEHTPYNHIVYKNIGLCDAYDSLSIAHSWLENQCSIDWYELHYFDEPVQLVDFLSEFQY